MSLNPSLLLTRANIGSSHERGDVEQILEGDADWRETEDPSAGADKDSSGRHSEEAASKPPSTEGPFSYLNDETNLWKDPVTMFFTKTKTGHKPSIQCTLMPALIRDHR